MALSDKRIIEEMERGDIVISPFNEANVSTSSYDVTLGSYYFRENLQTKPIIYNPFDKKEVERVWGTTPLQAETAEKVFAEEGVAFNFEGIAKDDCIILLRPRETILAHTEEFIGGRNHITTMMKARSSMGRNFIEICKCAGWGDVGFVNRWALEITNNSQRHTIPLVVGRRIGQVIFFETGEIRDKDYTASGKYQTSQDIEEIQKNWSPMSLLPKMYHDREIKR